ncbi:MAG: hypothetical protein R3E36_05110 [Nitrosomonas sp.]|nr:hypothetical protein [Nitrosomonas sp.]
MNQSYEDRYCLFLDILGFQSHVDDTKKEKAKENADKMTFEKLMAALNQIHESVHYSDEMEVSGKLVPTSRRVIQFSDSVVISYLKEESDDIGVEKILKDVFSLQLLLVQQGILLRGAITVGDLHHDEKLIFGPALNAAVEFERLANYPRVILSPGVLDNKKKKLPHTIAEDFDGLSYIDYFNVQPSDFRENWDGVLIYLEELRSVVKKLSSAKIPSLKVKHSWLRKKFNLMAEPFKKNDYKTLGKSEMPDDYVAQFKKITPFE